MTDSAACRCYACNRAATRVLERQDFGKPSDRVTVCDAKECQPNDGSRWLTFGLDGSPVQEVPHG